MNSKQKSSLSDRRIGVFCGGTSSERKISKRSGRAVYRGLKKLGFRVRYVDPADARKMETLLAKIDLAFLALHGRGGEDGTLQKFLEKARIPYTGSGPQACVRTLDKYRAKKIFLAHGLPTPDFVKVTASNWEPALQKFSAARPFFVKPLSEGSSIGVFAVEEVDETSKAKICQSVAQYRELLFERKITGREFTVGIVGERALPVVELKPRGIFYDYHCKYTKGMTEYVCPAEIPQSLKKKMQAMALRAHRCLGLRDFSRLDLMVDKEGNPYLLEANSIPGFTELSLLPMAAKADGMSFEALCRDLVGRTYQRHCLEKGITNGKA